MMEDWKRLVRDRDEYRKVGDADKPYHEPTCRCVQCESWRRAKDRPTFGELDRIDKEAGK